MQAAGIEAIYRERLADRERTLAARERAHIRFGNVRLLIAATAIAIPIIWGPSALGWLLAPVLAFIVTAILHGRLLEARDRTRSAVDFYNRGLARLAHEWIGTGRTGEPWRPPGHIYADDLDLFGRGSIFELLATTRTKAGEETLARWLLSPADPAVVASRQAAVRELRDDLDLRERIAVLGDRLRVGLDATMLRTWATAPIRLRGATVPIVLVLLAALATGTLGWWSYTGDLAILLLVVLGLQTGVARWLEPRVEAVVEAVDEPSHDLDLLGGLLRTIEEHAFASAPLVALTERLRAGPRTASSEIAGLARIVALLSSSHNVVFAPIARLWTWSPLWAFAVEAWRRRTGPHVPQWIDTVGEFEALVALAGFAAEHPDFVFPELVDGPPRVSGLEVAHPALGPAAVANDVELGGEAPHLVVVSGSNMSGKSTWLRTVGVNVVLALAGAPVRAATFRLSPLQVGASISIHDSLTDGRSRFFAEITRIKEVVDAVRDRQGAVLFLLDEILSGTNSHDRRLGAQALLAGLLGEGAIGMVTTHDLALGEIADRLDGRAVNAHFADRFEQDTLVFDYVLRPGVVRTSNAIALMRSIGLDV